MKEDGEYTCVPVNSLGAGSNVSVSITSVGECDVWFFGWNKSLWSWDKCGHKLFSYEVISCLSH